MKTCQFLHSIELLSDQIDRILFRHFSPSPPFFKEDTNGDLECQPLNYPA
jgi:hypothetical protein